MPRFLPKLALLATVAAAPCPDHESRACLDYIRAAIDAFEYARGRDAAETQCYGEPKADAKGRVSVAALLTTTSGCHYLYALERFFGNGMRAVEAREKARQISGWGCQAGYAELCEAQVALLEDAWRELLHEVEDEARKLAADVKRPLLQSMALRSFATGRAFPRAFTQQSAASLRGALSRATGREIAPECGTSCQAHEALDARIELEGGGLVLTLRIFDVRSRQLLWEKSFASRDVAERQRLFGFTTSVPEGPLSNRLIDAYEPAYKLLVGVGAARLPNTSGSAPDHDRLVVQVRSVERFNDRRDEFGLMLGAHLTRRSFVDSSPAPAAEQAPADEAAADEAAASEVAAGEGTEKPAKVPAYERAYALYGIYNRMLFAGRETYDSIRPSLNVAVGGWVSGFVLAPSARLGSDLYLGRRFALGAAWVYVGKSTALVEGVEVKVPAVQGSEVVLSVSF